MQTARLPCSTCDEINRKIRRFLWEGTCMEKHMHLEPWDLVTKPRSGGGLGIDAMHTLNTVQLMKVGWHLVAGLADL